MRLLYVIDSLAPGGAETSLAAMTPGLVSAGVDLHVLPLGQALDLAPQLLESGATVHRRLTAPGRPGNVRAVLETARRVRPDLVHTTLYEANVAGRLAARLSGLPASTSIVGDMYGPVHYSEVNPLKLRLAQALDRSTIRFATLFHAVSESLAREVGPRLGIPSARIEVIPRGRDARTHPYRPAGVRERTRAGLGVNEQAPVVLAVGRHEPAKGLHHLMACLPGLASRRPDLVVLVAGREGRSSAELYDQAEASGTSVHFLGHRSDVSDLLAAADVLCFPSEREGSPGTLIEALAVGCPIVASDISPVVEVLGADDDVALLTAVGDPVRLAESLARTIADPASATARAKRGRERFEQYFGLDSVVERMARFFEKAQDSGAGHRPSGDRR